jgi:hypothetical protein
LAPSGRLDVPVAARSKSKTTAWVTDDGARGLDGLDVLAAEPQLSWTRVIVVTPLRRSDYKGNPMGSATSEACTPPPV